jgi:hypothetical protein
MTARSHPLPDLARQPPDLPDRHCRIRVEGLRRQVTEQYDVFGYHSRVFPQPSAAAEAQDRRLQLLGKLPHHVRSQLTAVMKNQLYGMPRRFGASTKRSRISEPNRNWRGERYTVFAAGSQTMIAFAPAAICRLGGPSHGRFRQFQAALASRTNLLNAPATSWRYVLTVVNERKRRFKIA